MTTSWQQFKNWVEKEAGVVSADFTTAEADLTNYFGPLFKQILAQAETIGKGDVQAGLTVLKDAVTTAVAAGVTAIAAGQSPVTAAETAFVSTTVSEGVTAVNNAEAGLIKAGVAIVQANAAGATAAVTQAIQDVVAPTPATPAA